MRTHPAIFFDQTGFKNNFSNPEPDVSRAVDRPHQPYYSGGQPIPVVKYF